MISVARSSSICCRSNVNRPVNSASSLSSSPSFSILSPSIGHRACRRPPSRVLRCTGSNIVAQAGAWMTMINCRSKARPRMRCLFEPRLVNDAFGDPGLYLDFRDERRSLLFDLGDISALAPRALMRLSHAFVTHLHMDHFSGFDHLLRVVLGRKAAIALLGGPGFIASVEHKLRAYTWNVVHRYEIELVLDVREVAPDGCAQRARFSSRTGFAREECAGPDPCEDVLHDETTFRVRGRFVDHDLPCLAFAIEEKARLKVDKARLAALGLGTGAWLRELKHAVLTGAPDAHPIEVQWRDAGGAHAVR